MNFRGPPVRAFQFIQDKRHPGGQVPGPEDLKGRSMVVIVGQAVINDVVLFHRAPPGYEKIIKRMRQICNILSLEN